MTWQRIDENIYIDDTLVTCAEYQLFIDEMRKLGKYYQPDHWTSYQFPAGKPREPILGIRHSDAVTFCEWLEQQAGKQWKYRLPNTKEANYYAISFGGRNPIGYWVNYRFEFTWIEPLLKNPSGLSQSMILNRVRKANASYKRMEYGSSPDLEQLVDSEFKRIHPVNIDLVLKLGTHMDDNYAYIISIDFERDLDIDFDIDPVKARIRILERVLDAICSNKWQSRWLEAFIGVMTLQERIAGRSPAFEGIRLVKERIR